MFGKRKLRAEIVRLQYRVKELEERLCPSQSHSWKRVDYEFVGGTGRGDEITVYTYVCEKCGKVVKTWKAL